MQTCLHSKLLGERPLLRAIKDAAELGFEAIELMGREPHLPMSTSTSQATEAARAAHDLGIKVACLATYTGNYAGALLNKAQADFDSLKAFLRLAEVFECPYVRHGPGGPPSYLAQPSHRTGAIEWMRRAGTAAADYGVVVLVETSHSTLADSGAKTLRLLNEIDHGHVAALYDPASLHLAQSEPPSEAVRALGSLIRHVHLRDVKSTAETGGGTFSVGDKRYCAAPLGHGEVDIAPVLRALAEAGYDRCVSIAGQRPGDRLAIAREEKETLDSLLGRSASGAV